ncbi:hypothetical protein C2E25_17155 [Geothermobacter hydrogeniphilus]|uniref:Curli production assembly/transport component CsgG n=1 Tax=Geothermobacter hydrogeniphilus TaxID=1969733 RepID=A0A2K2H5B8_9BACT|nr:hypothetical protein [Geothermobacter hydrogeniphilus]PNU18536.1 hypothetical protein C2E25_17155 [Geothermobacter hydrogeniphilus]
MVQKKIWFLILFLPLFLFCDAACVFADNGCRKMEREAGAIEGIVPRIGKNGKIESLSMYGEASFLSAKRSLISAARKQAELKAKREFANFLKEKLAAGTLSNYLMETATLTDQSGETSGYAAEVNQLVDTISSQTQAVISGVIKLDECVNVDGKYILVRMGWKPSLSAFAADASKAAARPMSSQSTEKKAAGKNQDSSGAASSSIGVKIVTVVVEGQGEDSNEAVRSGLRQAVSQVFGESLESEIDLTQTTQTLETSGAVTLGVAVESHSQTERSKSKTKGTIRSYKVLSKKETTNGVVVSLRVSLAKYESGIDRNKKTIIVLNPKLTSGLSPNDESLKKFASFVQGIIEKEINGTGKFNLLDREYLGDTFAELNFVASGNAPIDEMARLGNHVGADLILVTEVISYSPVEINRTVGNRNIKRGLLSAQVAYKLIDPATTKVVVSDSVLLVKQRVMEPSESEYAKIVALRISGRISRGSGRRNYENNDAERIRASKEANQKYKELEKKHEKDW